MKLYSYPNNYRAWKTQIAAAYNGLALEVVDNKSDDFKGKSITGKVPVLETEQGTLCESNAIARYVARLRADTGLYGSTFFQSAQVDQWIDFSANELEAARAIWLYPVLNIMPFNGKAYGESKKEVRKTLLILDAHLKDNTFMVGNQVTLADIAIACALVEMFKLILAPKFRAQFPNVMRWFNLCINQPKFAAVVGEVTFATREKMAPKPVKKVAPKKEKKKVVQQQPKKKKEKKKNPLDILPPSTMVLDVVKKSFWSKQPFNREWFTNEFFENVFDPAGYSFYNAEYQFNAENKVLFMTGNAVGGWLQRLDPLRKYGMGTIMILGKDEDTPPYQITSTWLFRGQDVPFEMADAPDSEWHTFTKIDTTNADEVAKIKTRFMEDTIDGLKVLDRRYYK